MTELEEKWMAIGEVRGRVAAVENRMDRSEVKIDTRLDRIDAQLDVIATALAGADGSRNGIIHLLKWLVGTIIALAGLTGGVAVFTHTGASH